MNILSNLKAPYHKKRKRIGRGLGSGHGKTATKGTKGQLSRSGYRKKFYFEGGQMPFVRRIPKRGFTNIFRKEYEIINVGRLEKFDPNTVIDPEFLIKNKIIKGNLPIKILGDGEITKPFIIKAHKFSKKAIEKIEKAGGKVEYVSKD